MCTERKFLFYNTRLPNEEDLISLQTIFENQIESNNSMFQMRPSLGRVAKENFSQKQKKRFQNVYHTKYGASIQKPNDRHDAKVDRYFETHCENSSMNSNGVNPNHWRHFFQLKYARRPDKIVCDVGNRPFLVAAYFNQADFTWYWPSDGVYEALYRFILYDNSFFGVISMI